MPTRSPDLLPPGNRFGPELERQLNPPVVRLLLVLILLLFTVEAAGHRWYADDAFITFRYARNLAEGEGLTWNSGSPAPEPPVLAFALLAAPALKLGANPVLIGWFTGTLAGVLILLLLFHVGRRRLGLGPWWALIAPALLALCRPFLLGAVAVDGLAQGTALAFLGTLRLYREQQDEQPGWVFSALLFAAAGLFRIELVLLHLSAALGLGISQRKRAAFSGLAKSVGLHGALFCGLAFFRSRLFGAAVPEALLAPFTQPAFDRGFSFLVQFLQQSFGLLWLPIAIGGLFLLSADFPALLSAFLFQIGLFLLWLAGSGGGAIEFLALFPLLPGLALLLSRSLKAIAVLSREEAGPSLRRRYVVGALAVGLVFSQGATLFLDFVPFGRTRSYLEARAQAEQSIAVGQVLAEFLDRTDRIATPQRGAVPYLTRAWHIDPEGALGRPPGNSSLSGTAVWRDLENNHVAFIDGLGRFLWPKPTPDGHLPAPAAAWVPADARLYCAELPLGQNRYWYFMSAQDPSILKRRLAVWRIRLVYEGTWSPPLQATPPTAATGG